MIPRQIEHKLHHLLQNTPVVALLGARQVGKPRYPSLLHRIKHALHSTSTSNAHQI